MLQSTARSSNLESVHQCDVSSYDVPGIVLYFLAIYAFYLVSHVAMLIGYMGVGPIQATAEQFFHVHSNFFTIFLDMTFLTFVAVYVFSRESYIFIYILVALFVRVNAELSALSSYSLSHSEFVSLHYVFLRRQYLRISDHWSFLVGCKVLFT